MIGQEKLQLLRDQYRLPAYTQDFPALLLVRRFWMDARPLNKKLEDLELLAKFLSPLAFPSFDCLAGKRILQGFYSYEFSQLAYLLKLTPIQTHYLSMLSLQTSSHKVTLNPLIDISVHPYYVKET